MTNICYHKSMEELNFEFYTRPNGHTEFQEYLDGLNTKARAKLLARIYMVATHGISVGIQHDWVNNWIVTYMKFAHELVITNNVVFIFMSKKITM